MPITITCSNCGRAYAADESLAGRRVRCRGCGQIVEIPAGDEPDLGALEQIEQTFTGDPAMMATHAGATPGEPQLPAGMEDMPITGAGIEAAGRANFRYNFFGAKTLDDVLPWLLVAGSLIWLIVQTSRNDDSGTPWITVTRVALPLLLFAVVVCPLTYTAMRSAGRKIGFQLPRTARWRTFASYLPAMTLTAALWMMGGGTIVAFIMGLLAGLLLASACVWILFRLKPEEVPSTAGLGALGFTAGAVLSAAVLTGLNAVARSVVESTQAYAAVPASPLGSGFDWTSPPPAPPTRAPSRPAPGPIGLPPESAANGTTAAPPPPVLTPDSSPGVAVDGGTLPPGINAPKSPLVAAFVPSPISEPVQEFLFPMTPSSHLATMRRDGDVIAVTVWNADPWQRVGEARFSASAGVGERMALSPAGDLVARLASFPTQSIHVWSLTEARDAARIPLEIPADVMPEIIGFLGPDRVVLRWNSPIDSSTMLDIYDVRRGMRARDPLKLGLTLFNSNAIAFSPSGAFIAVAAKVSDEPMLMLYAADRDGPIRSIRIRSLDRRWPVDPTGMAFAPDVDSADANVIALMFEQAGAALVVAYRMDGTTAGERVFDPGPPVPRPAFYTGSSLQWLVAPAGGKRWWLIYGQAVIDPMSGRTVGNIDLTDVERCAWIDRTSMLFVTGGQTGTRVAARARIDLTTLSQ